jgi:uracil-DNA glycosylase
MVERAKAAFAQEIAGAIDWWREAGVDCVFGDEPVRWLPAAGLEPAPAPPRPLEAAPSAAAAPGQTVLRPVDYPQDLAGFSGWWLNEPALDEGRTSGRVPPRGELGADYMVIVPDPEPDDRDRLLSGSQGRLLDAMLAAMEIAPERVYFASVLPRHMPFADWPALDSLGFGALLRHHVKLVAPRRLMVLGSNILPLLGHDRAHNPAVLREFNQEGVTIPLLAGKSLAALLQRPRWKAGLWQGWLDWTEGQPGRG